MAAKKKSASPAVKQRHSIEEALLQVVKLFLVQSPYKLTYSKISRATKIPRSTLYYYFGSKVESLLTEAVRYSLRLFFRLDSLDDEMKRFSKWEDLQVHRMTEAMQQVQVAPWGPRVYMLFRDDPGVIGKAAREVETKYLKLMQKTWKHYHPNAQMNEHLDFVTSALKIGLLWGISVHVTDRANKGTIPDPRPIAVHLTQLIDQILDRK